MGRVLVTGGTGFIGRRVVSRFLDLGWEVTSFSLPGEVALPAWEDRVRMVHGDLSEPSQVADAAQGCTLAIHLAAPVGVAGQYEWQWQIIANGTRHVCEAMAANSGRAVVASSIAVYGTFIRNRVCSEDVGHGPWAGAYGRAKQGQEAAALDFALNTGLPLTILRPANVYGLGGNSAWGDRLLDSIAATGGAVFGDAEQNDAGLVHVENLADALVLAGTRQEGIGKIYNVCDNSGVTWRRFMDDMAHAVGMPPPPRYPIEDVLALAEANENPATLEGPKDIRLPTLEGLNIIGFSNRIDTARIREELGWTPRVSYEQAIDWIAAQKGAPSHASFGDIA